MFVNKIAVYLNRHITGNVFDKDEILEAYSTESSLLKIKPRFVALPESTSDVRKLVRFVDQLATKKYNLPIAVRGSGLSQTGADLSAGLVISTERLNHVRELDAHDRLVHVQAGISLGKLNAVLAPHGLTLPISANPKETIGSLISNCPTDPYSHKYGGIMNYIDRIEAVLPNGDLIQTTRLTPSRLARKASEKSHEGKIYAGLQKLLAQNSALIENSSKHSSLGYPALRHLSRNHGRTFDLMPAFFGAEGNLGIITEVILRLDILPPRAHRCFAVFPNFGAAQGFANYCLKLSPLSIDIYDTRLFKALTDLGKKPDLLTKKLVDGYLVLVAYNDKSRKSRKKIHRTMSFLSKSAYAAEETLGNSADFDDFNTSLTAFLNSTTKGERPFLLNDFYVPPESMNSFLADLKGLEKASGRPLELFGSLATNTYSLRPSFNLEELDERRAALTLMRDLNELLIKHSGFLASGMPEGRLKSIIIYPTLDKPQKELISNIKDLFDPEHILAPETKSCYNTRSAVQHLRTSPLPHILER